MTIKIYDFDSHVSSFLANVISCERVNDFFHITLDKTAFFPQGGGQAADTGTLGNVNVLDVFERDSDIIHITDAPLAAESEVQGTLDWDGRLRRMQNHSGEHIVSGLIWREFGFNNVGFHMGSDDITLDIDGELTRQQIDKIELLANECVAENVKITAEYPAPEILKELEYRSKLDLTENVRIVTIDGFDKCACCAPHVSRTGEVGVVKLLDFLKYKGGTRIHMLCGLDAVQDYNQRYKAIAKISSLLSVKQGEVYDGVVRISDELDKQKGQILSLKKRLIQEKLLSIEKTKVNLCLFEDDFDHDDLRRLANAALELCDGICAAFSGSDEEGYRYVIASCNVDLGAKSKEINKALNGRGGGRSEMIQGSVSCSREKIEEFFNKNID